MLHETKGACPRYVADLSAGQAKELDETVIVPAFGAGMCPKLVNEVKNNNREIRVNALKVLCDVLKNPMHVVGCVEAGVVGVLNEQTTSSDPLTRCRASKALDVCARDSNGLQTMIDAGTPQAVQRALDDDVDEVRENVYSSLIRLSTGLAKGPRALVDAAYPSVLVGKAAREKVGLQPMALKLLRNCILDEQGLQDALDHQAVETCISLLASTDDTVRCDAANTLATLCFNEMAKITAIEHDATRTLVALLEDDARAIRSAAAGALMAITTTDEGKRVMVTEEPGAEIHSVAVLVGLLRESHTTLKLNALKCVANVAVHPRARKQMRTSDDCLALLDDLCSSSNQLLAKHAAIAKKAVLWEP